MFLTNVSLKRPVFATVTILALIVLGLFSYVSLNVEEYPDVEFPVVTVMASYPGASPEQVETKITQKIEETVSSVAGVKHINSTVREGISYTVIEFTLETSPAAAAQDVRDKVGRLRGVLPGDADEPVVMRFDPTEMPIASVVVTGNADLRELTTLVDDVVKRRLEAIDGVGSITVQGGAEREIQLNLDADKIAAYGLTVPEIIDSLRSENLEAPGGKVSDGERDITMRTAGSITAAEHFLNLPVARRSGVQLYVHNIAAVEDTAKDITAVTKYNGKQAIGLDIMKQSGANTVQVAKAIKQELENLKQDLPPGTELVVVRDNSKHIKESIDDVLFNLAAGGLLAVAIVFLFLGNWRSTVISAITIPASVISTFFIMKLLNFTLNTMSLLGLSLAVGLLIDDAIVVIENIARHMEMGKDKFTAALDGTSEIGLAVTATTLTIVAVFVPVGMMSGIAGKFFKQFGITVAFSVLVSLFIAFTLTPMLSAKYLDISHGHSRGIGKLLARWNAIFDRWTERYGAFLAGALAHRGKVLAVAATLFIGSLTLVPLLGASFIPESDVGEFTIAAEFDPGLSAKAAGDLADRLTDIVRNIPEVNATYSVATADSINIFTVMTPKKERRRSDAAVIAEVREKLNAVPGVKVSVTKKSGMSGNKPVSLVIQGESLDTLAEIAEQTQRIMERTPGAVDVSSSYKPGKPDARISVNRDRAADAGVSTANVADTLRTMFNGVVVGQFKEHDESYDIRVRLSPADRTALSDLSKIYLAGRYRDNGGQTVMTPLSQVTETVYATSPGEIRRYDREKQITLSSNLQSGVSLGQFNAALAKELEQIKLPPGYKFVTTGQSEQMRETFTNIGLALLMAVLFIFFVLAAQFESYIDPFSIMLSLPLAIIGAIAGLLVMRSDLSIMSLIGVIMLMGLVTKNAILLIDFAKQRRAEGVDRNQALAEAAVIRMRPIIMTTAAMIFGMIPLALGIGPGAEARAPMAHAIIGGLVTSTVLTLVVVPVVYTLIDDLKHVNLSLNTLFRRHAHSPGNTSDMNFTKDRL